MYGFVVVSWVGKVGIGEEDNQFMQGVFVYCIVVDVLEDVFEFFVVFFNSIKGIVNQFGDVRKFFMFFFYILR